MTKLAKSKSPELITLKERKKISGSMNERKSALDRIKEKKNRNNTKLKKSK